MAALSAKNHNNRVIILEKNNRIGKKILVTGNGRCNYTNSLLTENDYNNPDFVKVVYSHFGYFQTIDFFESIGILPKIENEGKAFPLSEQASSFLDVFLYEIIKREIEIKLEFNVKQIKKKSEYFYVIGANGETVKADKVILSTGGKAMPLTGSDGSGYEIAESFGHKLTNIFPALVKLRLDFPYLKHLSGVKINSQVDLISNEQLIQSEYGDILFTNYGISGPTILELSRKANSLLLEGKNVELRVVLIQSVSKAKLIDRFFSNPNKSIEQSLIGLVNKKFINVLVKESNIEKNSILIKDIDKSKILKLVNLLFDLRIKVIGSLNFEEAQITAGGVNLNDVNSKTLESKLIPGLFFAGEILDVDGRCGGFNLQWAWSSGYQAGKYASMD